MTPQEHYDQMVARGESPRMAEMLALRQPPGTSATDRAFMENSFAHDQFDTDDTARAIGKRYREMYRQATGGLPVGKKYISGLARYRGDPQAWIDSVSDAKRICQQNQWSCSGAVNVRSPDAEVPDDKPYMVADDIVERRFQGKLAENPDLAHAPAEKVKEIKHTIREAASGRG